MAAGSSGSGFAHTINLGLAGTARPPVASRCEPTQCNYLSHIAGAKPGKGKGEGRRECFGGREK